MRRYINLFIILTLLITLQPTVNAGLDLNSSIGSNIVTLEKMSELDWSGYWGGAKCSRSKPAEFGPKSNQLELQWEFETKYPEYLCTSGEYVVVSKSEREIVCLSMLSGEVEWTFKNSIDKNVSTCLTPISKKVRIYYASGGGLTCFEVDTGKVVWEYECEVGFQFVSNIVVTTSGLFIATHKGYRDESYVANINLDDGAEKNEYPLELGDPGLHTDRLLEIRIFTSDNNLYVCSMPLSNRLYLNKLEENFQIIYEADYDSDFSREEGNFVVSNGFLYFGGESITAIDTKNGVEIWEFKPKHSKNSVDGLSVLGENLFCFFEEKSRSGDKIVAYSLDANSGSVNWSKEIESTSPMITCGERLYIDSFVYSANNGQKIKALDKDTQPVAIANNRLFVSSPKISYNEDNYKICCYIDEPPSITESIIFKDVQIASENVFDLIIRNPTQDKISFEIKNIDTWLIPNETKLEVPPQSIETITVTIAPKRLYEHGLLINSVIEVYLDDVEKECNIQITTAHDIEEIDGWSMEYGNNHHTNFSDCIITETEPVELWEADLGSSEIISQPIVCKGLAYIGTADGVLHCLNAGTGEKLWGYDTHQKKVYSSQMVASVVDGKCYITANTAIYCLDAKSGKKVWGNSLDGVLTNSTVGDGMLFVAVNIFGSDSENCKIVCFDSRNGKVKWITKVADPYAKPLYYQNKLFIKGRVRYIYKQDVGILYSINANNGNILWKKEGDYTGSPIAIYNKRIYSLNNGILECLNASSGELLWKTKDYDVNSFRCSDIAIANGIVVMGIQTLPYTSIYDRLPYDCSWIAFNASNGEYLYSSHGRNTGHRMTPIITDNVILHYANSELYATSLSNTENEYWAKNINEENPLLSVAAGYIFYCSKNGYGRFNSNSIHCLGANPETKEYKTDKNLNRLTYQLNSKKYWSYIPGSSETEHEMSTAPQILSGSSYLPAKYVVEPLGGTVSWNGDERKVICKLGSTTIELWIGKKQAKVNGVVKNYDTAGNLFPQIVDGRTMVPMRFLAENLGCQVHWIASEKGIVITRK